MIIILEEVEREIEEILKKRYDLMAVKVDIRNIVVMEK